MSETLIQEVDLGLIKGDKGDIGEQGEIGPQGPQGIQGEKGSKGDKGDRGEKGCKGDKGDKGDRGCKGDKGDKGDRGCKGEKGDKGDPGIIGPEGAQGKRGLKGDKGDRGERGAIGPKGDKGDTGTLNWCDIEGKPETFTPIGCLIFLDSPQNPATIWLGTTWDKIEGKFILGTEGNESSGTIGGSKKINKNQLPIHDHPATSSTISLTTEDHIHLANGTLDYGGGWYGQGGNLGGFSKKQTDPAGGKLTGSAQPIITVGNTGNGEDYLPPFYKIHIWKRTS